MSMRSSMTDTCWLRDAERSFSRVGKITLVIRRSIVLIWFDLILVDLCRHEFEDGDWVVRNRRRRWMRCCSFFENDPDGWIVLLMWRGHGVVYNGKLGNGKFDINTTNKLLIISRNTILDSFNGNWEQWPIIFNFHSSNKIFFSPFLALFYCTAEYHTGVEWTVGPITSHSLPSIYLQYNHH